MHPEFLDYIATQLDGDCMAHCEDGGYIGVVKVQEHTIDKQVVRDAIKKCTQDCDWGLCINPEELLKELRLDGE
jgi:hypothetical protein